MFILRHFVMDAETSVGVKKYPSFSYLYKETSGSKDIKYEKWIPPIKDYLTEGTESFMQITSRRILPCILHAR